MALPVVKIKNITDQAIDVSGIRVLADEEVEIEPFDRLALSANTDMVSYLYDGYMVVLYDETELDAETGLSVLSHNVFINVEGQPIGYAHRINISGVAGGAIGDAYGGVVNVEVGSGNLGTQVTNVQTSLDGYVEEGTLADIFDALDGYVTTAEADTRVKVSSNDTTTGYLSDKLAAGTGITLTEQNDGGNETIKIDAAGGSADTDGYLLEEDHRPLDELVHLISEDSFEEVTYSAGNKVSSMIIYTDSGKTTKIREEQYTYDSWNRVSQILSIQYNIAGDENERMVEDFAYDSNRVTSITRDVTLT